MTSSERLAAAAAIAREAGALALAAFRARPADAAIVFKGAQDYLSATDTEVEQLIRARLAERFPGELFFGEEGGGDFGGSEPGRGLWVVDPIDGTGNFVRGIPGFCISLGFMQAGRVAAGLIYDPVHGEMFEAAPGAGARLNGRPIRVSGLTDLTRATIEAGWSTRPPMEAYVAMLGRLAGQGAGLRRGGSGALGLAYVAAGRVDGYCELHINSWDCLAGLLLVAEAGGWTNDFLAGDGLRQGNPLLACTPGLRERLVELTGIG